MKDPKRNPGEAAATAALLVGAVATVVVARNEVLYVATELLTGNVPEVRNDKR